MISVRNIIDLCRDDDTRYRTANKTFVMVHRISFAADPEDPTPDHDLTGLIVHDMFRDKRKYRAGSYTGGKDPYPIVLRADGWFDQTLPLLSVTPHAWKQSRHSIAIAVVGDHRYRDPTLIQRDSLCDLLAVFLSMGLAIWGHDELENASRDKGKECPGKFINMDRLRKCAASRAPVEKPNQALLDFGFIW